ncbi:MAG: hypothetical protein JWQ02_4063 [Capsulimonas sp.]|nr:hypothetical protein [Capsulimonas sp.]
MTRVALRPVFKPKALLPLLRRRQTPLHRLRQPFGETVRRHPDGRRIIAQRVLGHDLLLLFAKNKPDGGRVLGMAEKIVHGGEVEVHLAGVLRQKLAALELDHHVAAQFDVIKEQVQVVIVLRDLQVILTAQKREPRPKLQQELPDLFDQPLLDLPLGGALRDGEEVEIVGIFEQLPGKVGLRGRQRPFEIGDCLSLPLIEPALDLMNENVTAPSMLNSLLSVLVTFRKVF